MKIKNRLYMSAGISIILAIIGISVVLVTSGRIAEKNKEHELLMNVSRGIAELDLVTYDYLLHREERMEQQWNSRYHSLGEILDELAEEEELISIRADYAALGDLFSQATTNYERRQKLIQEGASQESIDAAIGLEERLVTQLLIASHSIITDAYRLAEEAHAGAMAAQRLGIILTPALMIILAIAVATSSLLIARSISKPLDELTKGTEIIGKGDLEHKVRVKTKDELGQLDAAFNKMTASLKKVTASRDELDREVTERKCAEEEIIKANTELAAVNKELEAFAYSVSHDLRAPLRSIDGFSQALIEDYPDRLDEQGKDYLQRVRSASQRMGVLIDDLLSLSRVTRSEMRHETVDLSALAQSIAEELQETQPERQVAFVIASGLTTSGDPQLWRLLMENLLSNSWKFTGYHPKARIEFGATRSDGKEAFFVRDDGAGFDMTYADKLFGVFQRLHAQDEFPGNGVGLATVQRIAHRHGGQVWAEGEVGKGATFYFTLE
ncbi:ATP-binding protein [Chloroflexota bacterium]